MMITKRTNEEAETNEHERAHVRLSQPLYKRQKIK